MKTWNLSNSKDGYFVTTYEIPWFAPAIENTYFTLCHWTRGWLGGHGLPEIFWKIPVGKAVRDEDGWLTNSVAGALNNLENSVANWSARKESKHQRFPVSEEIAELLAPDFVKDMKELYSDD